MLSDVLTELKRTHQKYKSDVCICFGVGVVSDYPFFSIPDERCSFVVVCYSWEIYHSVSFMFYFPLYPHLVFVLYARYNASARRSGMREVGGGKERYAAGISSILYCCQLKITEIIGPLQTELDILATVYQAKFRCTLNDFISIQMASIALLEQTKKKTMKCSWYGEYGGRIGH